MNFLALVQRAMRECGSSGVITTVAAPIAETQRFLDWVTDAWNDIQVKHDDWEFMRSSSILGLGTSFATVAGQASYPLGTGAGTAGVTAALFGKWDRETFRVQVTAQGHDNETFLDWIPYDSWRDSYMYGAMRDVQTRPVAMSIGPDKSICLGPPPDGTYTVTGDFFKAPTTMAADTDLPTGLPAQFQMLIVYGAMMKYSGYEAAPEVLQRGQIGYDRMMVDLESVYAPETYFAGALC